MGYFLGGLIYNFLAKFRFNIQRVHGRLSDALCPDANVAIRRPDNPLSIVEALRCFHAAVGGSAAIILPINGRWLRQTRRDAPQQCKSAGGFGAGSHSDHRRPSGREHRKLGPHTWPRTFVSPRWCRRLSRTSVAAAMSSRSRVAGEYSAINCSQSAASRSSSSAPMCQKVPVME